MAVLYEGKFLTLHDKDGWEFVERPASAGVVIVAALVQEELIFIEQYRASQGGPVISLPGGLVDKKTPDGKAEAVADAARRELLEETGFDAGQMEMHVTGPISPGMTTETVTFFVARDLTQKGAPTGDGDEAITVHRVPLRIARTWLVERQNDGASVDVKVYVGLALLGAMLPAGQNNTAARHS